MFVVIYHNKGFIYSTEFSILWVAEAFAQDLIIDGVKAEVYEVGNDPK